MALGINRSSYYKWLNHHSIDNSLNEELEILIAEIYQSHKGTYGRKQITIALNNMGYKVNHKRVYRIMCKLGIQGRIRRRWRAPRYIKHARYDNILDRNFNADKPMQKFVCDVTEISCKDDKRHFMFAIMDLYNGEIVSYNYSNSNNNDLVISKIKDLPNNTLIHSDQGIQFTSLDYSRILSEKNIIISMSHVGECYDNARIESFFGHFKDDLKLFHEYSNTTELQKAINETMYYYNNERIHTKLKMSPVQYRTQKSYI